MRQRREAKPALETQHINMLAQLLADVRSREEALQLLDGFFTPKEKIALTNRLAIAYYLSKGRTSVNIRQNLKATLKEINEVKKALKTKGLALAVKKIEAEEFAAKWSERIRKIVK